MNPTVNCPFKDLPEIPDRNTVCERGLYDDDCKMRFDSTLDEPYNVAPNGRNNEPVIPSFNPFDKSSRD